MGEAEILATVTIEKRENGLGTSPRVVELIPRRAGSISSLYGALTNLKAKKLCLQPQKKSPPHETALLHIFRSYHFICRGVRCALVPGTLAFHLPASINSRLVLFFSLSRSSLTTEFRSL